MKKTLALLLAVLTVLSMFTLSLVAFAEDAPIDPNANPICEFCGQRHTSYNDAEGSIAVGSCRCCLQCDYLDTTALTKCCRDDKGNYSGYKCCDKCTGFFPCLCNENNDDCNCAYCGSKAQQQDGGPVEVVPAKAKNLFSSIFSNVMGKLSEVFNNVFKVLFSVFGVED